MSPVSLQPPTATMSSRHTFAVGALAVLVVYSLPLFLGFLRTGYLAHLLFTDESIYAVRVLDIYRGGNVASPYLPGHDDAPRFMPELGERALTLAARLTRIPPLTVLALSRVVVALLIFFFLWRLAGALDFPPLLALLATLIPVLGLSTNALSVHFLRYMRLVSPAIYVLVLLFALYGWLLLWKKPKAGAAAVLAAVTTGALFYTPVYYWSFAALGALVLGIISADARRWILSALAIAVVIGAPALVHSAAIASLPEVQQTLHRLDLLTPGRAPDVFVLPRFIAGAVFCILLWTQRRRAGANAKFLLAFLVPGTLLLVQNAFTNRHAQSYHVVECLIPTGALALCAMIRHLRFARPALLRAAVIVIVVTALGSHAGAYFRWEADVRRVGWLTRLDAQFPATLTWINAHIPPSAVLLASDYTSELPMYVANKMYFATYAFQQAITDDELQRREETWEPFDPAHPARLPYPADLYVGFHDRCATATLPVLYRNPGEGTCVLDLRTAAFQGR